MNEIELANVLGDWPGALYAQHHDQFGIQGFSHARFDLIALH
jgi:hypothetical protein